MHAAQTKPEPYFQQQFPVVTIMCKETWSFENLQSEKRPALIENEECVCETRSFDWRPLPPSATIILV